MLALNHDIPCYGVGLHRHNLRHNFTEFERSFQFIKQLEKDTSGNSFTLCLDMPVSFTHFCPICPWPPRRIPGPPVRSEVIKKHTQLIQAFKLLNIKKCAHIYQRKNIQLWCFLMETFILYLWTESAFSVLYVLDHYLIQWWKKWHINHTFIHSRLFFFFFF